MVSSVFTDSIGNSFLFSILVASASYIAVPAAMCLAAQKANPSLCLPMALAITFPFNLTIGMQLYLCIVQSFSIHCIIFKYLNIFYDQK